MSDIRYDWLRYQNGYSYRECEIPLGDQGLVLVRGLNLDEGGFLGAGKTSPFEVFSLVQTGKVGKHRKGESMLADDVVNLQSSSGFEGRLRLDVDAKSYELVQCRAHSRYGNTYSAIDLDAGRNIIPKSVRRRPQKWVLSDLLNTDETSFFHFIYMPQDFVNAMLSGTDGERQQSIIKMYGLEVYDQLRDRCQAKLSALSVTVQDIDKLTTELKDIKSELQEQEKGADELKTDLVIKKAELQGTQSKHDKAMDKVDALQEKLEPLERRSRLIKEVKQVWEDADLDLDSPREVDADLVDSLKTTVREIEEAISETKSAIRLFDQRHIIEKRLETLSDCDPEEAQEELNGVRDTLRRLANKELPKAEQKAELVSDLRQLHKPSRSEDDIQEELEEAALKGKDLERQINSAKDALENDVCPTCGRPFEEDAECDADELKARKKKLQKKLSATQKEVHGLRTELNNASEYNKVKEKLQALGAVASAADVQKEITRLTREEKRLVGALESRQLRQTLEKQLNDLPSESKAALEERLKKHQKKLNKFKQQYEVAQRILIRLEKIAGLPKGKPAKLRGRIIEAKKAIRDAMVALTSLSEEKAELQKQYDYVKSLTKRQAKIEKGLEKTKQTKTEIACLRALEKVFGSKGLKRDRFMAILRDAAEQTVPYYTNLLWPKRNTEITLAEANNTVKFELLRDGVVTGSRLLSGGERNKAGLALLFGLRDLKEKYTGLKSNVLIIDEPFGNLDPYGTDNLIRVLANQKQRFSSVFVIGNQRDVLEHDIWDQVWWAVKEGGVSTLYTDGLPECYTEAAERYQNNFG